MEAAIICPLIYTCEKKFSASVVAGRTGDFLNTRHEKNIKKQ